MFSLITFVIACFVFVINSAIILRILWLNHKIKIINRLIADNIEVEFLVEKAYYEFYEKRSKKNINERSCFKDITKKLIKKIGDLKQC